MNKKFVSIIVCSLIIFSYLNLKSAEGKEFERIDGMYDTNLFTLRVNSLNQDRIFVGSDKAIFKSVDNGNNWKHIYTIKGERSKVNYIYFSHENLPYVYVATGSGLLRGGEAGEVFREVFSGNSPKQNVVYHVKVENNVIYAGTAGGLFFSKERKILWKKVSGLPADIEIYWIEFDSVKSSIAYIATSLGVYKTIDNFKNLVKVFSSQRVEIADLDSEGLVEDAEYYAFLPKVISIDKNDSNKIFLGTSDGLFVSFDKGESWRRKFMAGLGRAAIRSITQSDEDYNILFVAADKGFFELNLKSDTTRQYYKGLTTNDIRYATVYSDNKFLLATNKGLFKSSPADKSDSLEGLTFKYKKYFKYEPTIREVRIAAIEYNDISSDKIRKWQEISRKKAWLPDLSIGVDRNVTDLYYWDSTTEAGGDAVLRKGDDVIEWDVSFAWDLGDLIWSSDQTSIDVRSRLNTQLRIDILEEVNRLYFERYRLKLELLSSSSNDSNKKRLEKLLRLQEMTAALDYYTGGFFSRRIKELEKSKGNLQKSN